MAGDGGRRAPTPSTNPHAQSHEALKAMTDAANPAGSQAIADGWAELATRSDEAGELFQRAIQNSEPGWMGESAEAMRAHLARIAAWTRQTGAAYQAASEAIGRQGEAAASAKSSMPPPVPYDPAQMIRDATASGNIGDLAALPFRMYEQKQKHDAAHDEAARVVGARDRAFGDAAASVPSFAPPPLLNDGVAAGPVLAAGGALAPPRPRTPGPDARPPRPPQPAPARRPVPAGQQPGGSPAPVTAPPALPVTPAEPPPGVAASGLAAGPVSLPAGPAGPPVAPPAGTTPAAALVAPAAPGPAFGPGGFGPSGAGGFGPGGSPLPVAPSRVVTEARGGADLPAAAGTANRQQDAKRKRPEYLIEPDAEGMFGSDAVTSPPVIGEK